MDYVASSTFSSQNVLSVAHVVAPIFRFNADRKQICTDFHIHVCQILVQFTHCMHILHSCAYLRLRVKFISLKYAFYNVYRQKQMLINAIRSKSSSTLVFGFLFFFFNKRTSFKQDKFCRLLINTPGPE